MGLPTAAASNEEIHVEECGQARVVTLNRPKQLNALTHLMVERLRQLYEQWECDNRVSLVIIKGSGRAFCAGGDVAETFHFAKSGYCSVIKEMTFMESILNYILGTYVKPYVALLDGIVMGGGAGVSIHGPIRVVTENTVFSMPETVLGFHPDIGASYFLSHLPGHLGEYAGLTAARLDGAEMLACGLATHFVPSNSLFELEKALKNFTNGGLEGVNTLICKFTTANVNLQERSCLHRLAEINRCFSKSAVEQILQELDFQGDGCHGWYKATAEKLRRASPFSLKVTLKSIREGRHGSLADCLKHEYRLSIRFLDGIFSRDFYEGVRAILVDKDKKPKWNPPSLELVTSDMVDHYFSPLKDNEAPELELPIRYEDCTKRIVFSRL
ncbi:hypothetical protein GOP47_0014777 [Adiantum capillus-veneris]|uniref:3-hydroxyisobutyryl-CoA hydrolase n=1 Tax=Adiantum capillus-veneris TaxID=13818 RepID=A0A9D4ZCS8_ADICA|nr:hypothetical protein GOP47_0014777 [Adiantum capillus-veneris]